MFKTQFTLWVCLLMLCSSVAYSQSLYQPRFGFVCTVPYASYYASKVVYQSESGVMRNGEEFDNMAHDYLASNTYLGLGLFYTQPLIIFSAYQGISLNTQAVLMGAYHQTIEVNGSSISGLGTIQIPVTINFESGHQVTPYARGKRKGLHIGGGFEFFLGPLLYIERYELLEIKQKAISEIRPIIRLGYHTASAKGKVGKDFEIRFSIPKRYEYVDPSYGEQSQLAFSITASMSFPFN